jgi:16S rRNA (uracil1498-N3)-methyltransferase
MIKLASDSDVCLFCYEGDGTVPLGQILRDNFAGNSEVPPRSISVVIGSEGGFSKGEAKRCEDAGKIMTGLGKRILRTETASGFVLASIVCFSELF